jgi:hypothetical protein
MLDKGRRESIEELLCCTAYDLANRFVNAFCHFSKAFQLRFWKKYLHLFHGYTLSMDKWAGLSWNAWSEKRARAVHTRRRMISPLGVNWTGNEDQR